MKALKLWAALAVTAIMVLAASSALAVTMTVGTGSGSADQAVQIPITVDDPVGVAGAAFTIQYDTNALSVIVSSDFFDTFANQWVGTPGEGQAPTSVVVDGVTYYQPLIENEVSGTGMRVAAARCTAEDNPSKTTLFTLTVSLNVGSDFTTYPISIVSTVLDNTDAGYDPAGETVPMLIGSDLSKEVTDPAAFPIILDPPNAIGSTVAGSATFSPPDEDGDGISDVWETNFFANLTTANATSDYDKDGYSDRQEYLNGGGYNPTIQDPPDGPGYDPTTDNRLPHFPTPSGTNDWEDYYGNLIVASSPAEVGDEVAVYAGDLIVGKYVVDTEGLYGFLHVYGESSPGAGDGASSGSPLVFKIWDKSTMTEYSATTTVQDSSPDPPQYEGGYSQKEVDLETVMAQRIPLRAGWNLISFSVNMCFYDSESPPDVDMMPGVQYQKLANIGELLGSIDGKYTTVSSFDKYYAHTFDPDPAMADFNDLHYMAPGYGYWIKMTEPGVLEIDGARVSSSATLDLSTGWNLVGYWLDVGKYDSDTEPDVDLPEGASFTQVDSISTVLSSIDGKYTTVSSFDKDYAHTFDPDPAMADFNDLHYMAPGYGYWIKMTEPGTLSY
jgi:hypothetical protein